ncbi:Proton-coupled folate transporter [Escovopsis weberi]|uniref:Proton-coupled folate transporter n=1 Tax=Escovopsis weberi TaxID=150374 RepID=A0A0M8MUL8_ESCWE|nr:Proton-coupled folate transporter [Escovopsis weberi]
MGIRSSASGEEALPFLGDGHQDDHGKAGPVAAHDDDSVSDNDKGDDNDNDDDDDQFRDRVPPRRPRSFGTSRWHAKSPRTIVLLVSVLKFIVAFCFDAFSMPVFRLLEDLFCHIDLKDDSLGLIEEMQCKSDSVQSQLAYMLGWLNLTTSIMSLVATLFFGTLADRIGRRPTVFWNCFGIALSFPFNPIMLSLLQRQVRREPLILLVGSLFPLVGGGLQVLLATLYAMASDVGSDDEKATSFVYISLGASAGGFIGSLVAGGLLQLYGPWVPIFLVIMIMPLSFVILIFIPETLVTNGSEAVEKTRRGPPDTVASFGDSAVKTIREIGSSFTLLKNPNIPLILVYFLFHNARMAAYGSVLPQYLSKNFGWQLGQVSFLLSPLGVYNLVVLVATPQVSKLLTSPRFGLSGFGKDLWLSRACTLAFLIGALIEGFTSSTALFVFGIFIQASGFGNNPLARATMTHYVKPEMTSRLYVLISMAEHAGVVIGAPVLAWCFTFGMERGGVLRGLPWLYCAIFGGLTWLGLALVRPPRPTKERSDCEEGASGMEMKPLRAED